MQFSYLNMHGKRVFVQFDQTARVEDLIKLVRLREGLARGVSLSLVLRDQRFTAGATGAVLLESVGITQGMILTLERGSGIGSVELRLAR